LRPEQLFVEEERNIEDGSSNSNDGKQT